METIAPVESSARISILSHFSDLTDPRLDRTKLHSLHEILVMTLCAAICGADNWVAVELFSKSRLTWFRSFLPLVNGVPSHDTFGRLFASLDPVEFQKCFVSWAASLHEVLPGEVVAIDGKKIRRSYDTGSGKSSIHMVNAWATSAGVSLGQVATDAKSNEITAIPKLLELLSIKGCIVTIDAMGCQKDIAQKIVDKEADYLFSLKGNHSNLHKKIQEHFRNKCGDVYTDEAGKMSFSQTTNGDHGRIETRRVWSTEDISGIIETSEWPKMRCIIMVESERIVGEKTSVECRFYISSVEGKKASHFSNIIRSHWAVENSLHWVLDVAFREDESRIRIGYAQENFAVVRQMAINLIKKETSIKVGVANKRLNAAVDHDYMLKILGI